MNSPVRQAVVIVHGMGEQRPQQTLHGFISAALAPRADGTTVYYSEPDRVGGSFESRVYRARRDPATGEPEVHAQTDFYEYHWAHLMQGNRLGDLGPLFRRLLLRPPWRVPAGLRLAWAVFWVGGLYLLWAFARGPLHGVRLGDNGVATVVQVLLGTGVTSTAVVYLLTKVLPWPLTVSFVDVVRYLDTSPRSYAVRREIRKGMIDLLRSLHEVGRTDGKEWRRYDRIVVVAHSLGAYVAYDGITYLWSQFSDLLGASSAVPDGVGRARRPRTPRVRPACAADRGAGRSVPSGAAGALDEPARAGERRHEVAGQRLRQRRHADVLRRRALHEDPRGVGRAGRAARAADLPAGGGSRRVAQGHHAAVVHLSERRPARDLSRGAVRAGALDEPVVPVAPGRVRRLVRRAARALVRPRRARHPCDRSRHAVVPRAGTHEVLLVRPRRASELADDPSTCGARPRVDGVAPRARRFTGCARTVRRCADAAAPPAASTKAGV